MVTHIALRALWYMSVIICSSNLFYKCNLLHTAGNCVVKDLVWWTLTTYLQVVRSYNRACLGNLNLMWWHDPGVLACGCLKSAVFYWIPPFFIQLFVITGWHSILCKFIGVILCRTISHYLSTLKLSYYVYCAVKAAKITDLIKLHISRSSFPQQGGVSECHVIQYCVCLR